MVSFSEDALLELKVNICSLKACNPGKREWLSCLERKLGLESLSNCLDLMAGSNPNSLNFSLPLGTVFFLHAN